MELSFLIFTFLKARHENKVQVKVTGSRRLEHGAFLARTTSRAIATKFEEEIIRLKELCTYMDITVENQTKTTVFVMHYYVRYVGC